MLNNKSINNKKIPKINQHLWAVSYVTYVRIQFCLLYRVYVAMHFVKNAWVSTWQKIRIAQYVE